MNILITSAGKRVSLVRSFQKELKKIMPSAKVFAADANPELAAACHIADASLKVPRLDHPSYIAELINLCKFNEITLVIPTIDTELLLLAKNTMFMKEQGVTPLIAALEIIEKCRDKRKIHSFFAQHHIDVAREFSKDDYQLPLFIKPTDGSRSQDTYIIKNPNDLTDYHFKNEKLMFLTYLDPDDYDEYTCDLYYGKDHFLKCVVPRKRIEVRDGEVNKGKTVNNELVPYIKERLGNVKGAVGCFTAQFFKHRKENQIIGIEINPRFGGGFPLSYLAGANFPKWIIEEYLLKKVISPQFDCWESDLLMLRYDDEILVHGYKG
ncbi:ATP-grasp domain-containing protein [Leptobacterium sp. I13]|uniref:ATP-grasp domain-containing protein n=1 Tax=Leptobacterium meishanense TaxID=3128904 RepID=UPI0030EB24D3